MKITGVEEFLKSLEKESSAQPQLLREAQQLVDKLKKETPVDSGHARDSWKIIESKQLTIVNTADYIDDLNRGHSAQAPSFFVEKTLLSSSGVRPNGTIVRYESK